MANPLANITTAIADKLTAGAQKLASVVAGVAEKLEAVHKNVGKVTTALQSMAVVASAAGAISAAAIERMVAVSNPAIADRLRLSWLQVSGVLGQMFAPVVLRVADAVQGLAKWLYNLDPAIKAVVVAVGVAAVAAVAAIGAIVTGVMLLNAALTATSILSGGLTIVIGLVATALVGAAAAAGGLAGYLAFTGKSMQGFKDAFATAWNAVSGIFSAVWAAVQPVLSAIWNGVKKLWAALQPGFEGLKRIAASIITIFQNLRGSASGVGSIIESALGGAAEHIGALFTTINTLIEKAIDGAVKMAIAVKNILMYLAAPDKLSFEEMQRAIRLESRVYDMQKKRNREAMDAKRGSGKNAPMFGLHPSIRGIAEAKDEFTLASLRASAGLIDPAKRQNDLAEENNRLTREGNETLNEIRRNMGGGQRNGVGV